MLRYLDFTFRDVADIDRERIFVWRNSSVVRSAMYSNHLITKEEHYRWFDKIRKDEINRYLIFEERGNPLGFVCFTGYDMVNKKAFNGGYLGERVGCSNVGLGAAMEFFLLDYAFKGLKLHKLCCEVLEFNKKVVSQHLKFGYMEEGYFSKHIYRDNVYYDVHFLSIFQDVWNMKREIMYRKIFTLD